MFLGQTIFVEKTGTMCTGRKQQDRFPFNNSYLLPRSRMREAILHSHNTPSWRGAWLSTGTTLPFTLPYFYPSEHGESVKITHILVI
jgi:hypothetical protein